jgi:hypothetical protein
VIYATPITAPVVVRQEGGAPARQSTLNVPPRKLSRAQQLINDRVRAQRVAPSLLGREP